MFGINKFLNNFNHWQLIQAVFMAVIFILVIGLILELAIPVRLINDNSIRNYPSASVVNNMQTAQILQPESQGLKTTDMIIRSGLFKTETAISDKPMADKTIEMIRSRLKLRCIMELNGEPAAYVYIEGEGLQMCRVGDSVKDLFTVLGINEKTVEISIIGHKQILRL